VTAEEPLTAISLFAGIGGLDRAFHLAGVQVVAAVEIDVAARGVIHDRMPSTALFTDVREVTADEIRAAGFDPARGVLVAGWPCQDLSVAGRRLGLDGARSGLFYEVVRLLTDLRPRWFCLENVPGLLSAVCPCLGGPERVCGGDCDTAHPVRGGACGYSRGSGRCMELHGGAMGAVLGSLADLGYGIAYRVLDAQYFGVPQRRRRVVFVGRLGDWAAPAEILLEPEGGERDPAPGGTPRERTPVVAALRAGSGGGCGPDDNDAAANQLIVAPTLTAGMGSNVGHPGDSGKDQTVLAVAATLTAGSASGRTPGRRREDDINLVSPALTHHHGRNTPDQELFVPVSIAVNQDFSTGEDVAQPITGSNGQPGTIAVPIAFDWKTDGSERARPNISTARTSALGTTKQDAVAYQCQGSNVGPAGALRRGNGHTTGGVPFLEAAMMAVRRLTPVECERLQGYPDGWTATSWGKPQSDSARYRQLGNSVAVPVFNWIARRMTASASERAA
jgi:DNA (cytosine-5)-methyltransferase 1